MPNFPRIILDGDKSKAASYIGYAKGILSALKNRMSLGNLDQSFFHKRPEKDVSVYVSSSNGLDTIRIIGIGGGGGLILILTTVSNAEDYYGVLDKDGNSIYKVYFYTIKESGEIITISRTPGFTGLIARGLNLSTQTGKFRAASGNYWAGTAVPESPNYYSVVADNWIRYEEEIGAVDWRRYMIAEVPDQNLRWGDITYTGWESGFIPLIEGADKSQYTPTSPLIESPHNRHSYILNGGTVVTPMSLTISRRRYDEMPQYPLNFLFDTGQTQNFVGRLEYAGLERDGMFEWFILSRPIDEDGKATGTVVESSTKWKDLHPGIVDWTYHVPIVALNQEKALLRKVVGDGDPDLAPCGVMNIHETLYIGNEIIDTADYTAVTDYTVGNIVSEKTVLTSTGAYDNTYMHVEGNTCPVGNIGWNIISPDPVPPYVHLDRDDFGGALLWASSTGCIDITVEATCGGCPSATIIITVNPVRWCQLGQSYLADQDGSPPLNCVVGGAYSGVSVYEPHGATVNDPPALSVGRYTQGRCHFTSNGGCWDHDISKTWATYLGLGCSGNPDGDGCGIGKATYSLYCYRASCTAYVGWCLEAL